MATAAGIFNQQMTAGQALTRNAAAPMASATAGTSGTSSSSDTSGSSATVSANDFLTLLVTEMKNQDPTANTDPNEYINQLVNVNSLEQLIDINQTLTADSTSSSSGSGAKPVVTTAASGAGPTAAPRSAAHGAGAHVGQFERSQCQPRRATRGACFGRPDECGHGAGNFASQAISLVTCPVHDRALHHRIQRGDKPWQVSRFRSPDLRPIRPR